MSFVPCVFAILTVEWMPVYAYCGSTQNRGDKKERKV